VNAVVDQHLTCSLNVGHHESHLRLHIALPNLDQRADRAAQPPSARFVERKRVEVVEAFVDCVDASRQNVLGTRVGVGVCKPELWEHGVGHAHKGVVHAEDVDRAFPPAVQSGLRTLVLSQRRAEGTRGGVPSHVLLGPLLVVTIDFLQEFSID